ncbi:MAG TPA: GYF domain-containing protein [Propionicimonas sp.]
MSAPAGAALGGTTSASADSGFGAPVVDDAAVTRLLAPERRTANAAREVRAKPETPGGFSASEAEWFIAIDDRPVGPVGFEEILARFKKGEVVATTLCWREGMADWAPAREVPRLAARLGLDSEPALSPAGAVAMGPQAPCSPPTEKRAEVGLHPSCSLDSLVRAELDALDELAARPVRRPASTAGEERGSMPRGSLLPPAAEVEEVSRSLPAGTRAPQPWPRVTPSRPIALYVVIGLLAVLAAGALTIAAVVLIRSPTAAAPSSEVASASAPPPAPIAAPEQTAAPEPKTPAPAPAPAPQPAAAVPEGPTEEAASVVEPAKPSAEQVAKAPPPQGPVASHRVPKPSVPPRAAQAAPARRARATERRRPREVASSRPASEPKSESASEAPSAPATAPRGDAVDRAFNELVGGGPAGPTATSPAPETKPGQAAIPPEPGWGTKAKLTQSDILDVVTSNRARIRACTDPVRVPGQARTVVLRWTILPDGRASAPAVVTPELRDTPLARCLTEAIGSLRFPAYSGPPMEPVELPVRF